MKYTIDWNPVTYLGPDMHRGTMEVDGSPVKFNGFERFEWFVYQAPSDGAWAVSEVSTGMRVGSYRTSKVSAIRNASTELCKAGLERVTSIIEKELRRRDPYRTSGVVMARRRAKTKRTETPQVGFPEVSGRVVKVSGGKKALNSGPRRGFNSPRLHQQLAGNPSEVSVKPHGGAVRGVNFALFTILAIYGGFAIVLAVALCGGSR